MLPASLLKIMSWCTGFFGLLLWNNLCVFAFFHTMKMSLVGEVAIGGYFYSTDF